MNTHMKALSPIRYPSLILPGGLTRPSYYPLHFFFMNLFGFLYFVEFYARSKGFLGGAVVKNPPANAGDAGDMGSIPRSEISPEGGNGSPLQYSCLENRMDRGALWATVHGVPKSWTQLSDEIGERLVKAHLCNPIDCS